MTLIVAVGSSGSGKTTFLHDVHALYKCTYVTQYHKLRPYISVRKIPAFDPSQLPFWKLYSDETLDGVSGKNASYNANVKIGGTMGGAFTAGLSGGQRKMMIFELVRQRTRTQSELLIVLDEPFAGVTDDFVPYIMERLDEMRLKHNILLVTNDHIAALTKMADSTITVSAIDRSKVSPLYHYADLTLTRTLTLTLAITLAPSPLPPRCCSTAWRTSASCFCTPSRRAASTCTPSATRT